MNDEVVHGIPHKDHILHEGDIVSLDAGLIYKGYHSDMARTFPVGQVSEEARLLMERTKGSFFAGIEMAKAGMINIGRPDVAWLDDDWTVVTEDGSLSAHYENTVLITDGEPEILTMY